MLSSSAKLYFILAAAAVAGPDAAFVPSSAASSSRSSTHAVGNDDDETAKGRDGSPIVEMDKFRIPNPLAELADIFSNFDDVVDDFFNKRMGNGEVFYGKRKYKPSGKVSSEYNGGGFSDWRKIEAAREFREVRAMMKEKAKEEKGGGQER